MVVMLLIQNGLITQQAANAIAGSEVAAYMIPSLYYFGSYLFAFSQNHLKVSLKNLSPFRGRILGTVLKNTLIAFLREAYDSLLAFIVVVCYARWVADNNRYASYSIICFFVYRCLSKIANSFNASMVSFLESFFSSNMRINNYSRVHKMMLDGHVVSLFASFVFSGLVYSISGFVADVVFMSSKYDAQEKYQLGLVTEMLKMAGVTGITQTAGSFVQALCNCQNQKFTHASLIAVDYIYLVIVSAYYLTKSKFYNYSKVYIVGRLYPALHNGCPTY